MINKAFEDANGTIKIVANKTPSASGKFEVSVNGDMVHAKKASGDGFPDTDENLEKIFAAIENAGATRASAGG